MIEDIKRVRDETELLIREAGDLGIELPDDEEWWGRGGWSERRGMVDVHQLPLTDFGKRGARKLIREERRKLQEQDRQDIAWERQQAQWRLTKWGVIIGWLLGVAGILIALLKK